MRNFLLLVSVMVVVPSFGCSGADEDLDSAAETSEDELLSRSKGSALKSVYARPTATYLSSRRIETLASVGALPGALASLASRADGIIANKPEDGRVSLQELIKLEKKGFIETLFPEEKAALPAFWALMETDGGAAAATPTVPAAPKITVTDLSTPAGTLKPPSELVIASLPAGDMQTAARRVELTHDSDGDALSISKSDLDAVIANPGPYTEQEVATFKAILSYFETRAVSSIRARASLPKPLRKQVALGTFSGVAFGVEDRITYTENRSLWQSSPSYPEGRLQVDLYGTSERVLSMAVAGTPTVVLLHEGSESESIVKSSGDLAFKAGTSIVEVWTNGIRTGVKRVKLSGALDKASERVSLNDYVDFELEAGGAPLFKSVVTAKSRAVYNAGTSYDVTYSLDTVQTSPTEAIDSAAIAMTATPTSLVPGRYEFPQAGSGVSFEIAPSGAAWFTTPSKKYRARVHYWRTTGHFLIQYDNITVNIDPTKQEIGSHTNSGSPIFEGVLDPSKRTG